VVFASDAEHGVRLLERGAHSPRNLHQRLQHGARALFTERPFAASEVHGQKEQRCELRGEALGGRHADLRSGMGVEGAVRGARDGAVDHVADREHLGSRGARSFDGAERVHGFARLADGDDQVARGENRAPIAHLAA